MQGFSSMLECVDDKTSYKFAPLTIQLLPFSRAEKVNNFVINIHGSIIVQVSKNIILLYM